MREDAGRVAEVLRALERHEFAPWIDQRSLEPGEVWENLTKTALRDSDRLPFIVPVRIDNLDLPRANSRDTRRYDLFSGNADGLVNLLERSTPESDMEFHPEHFCAAFSVAADAGR
ncbi:MAG: toll/interleukin-1 receptor domain-containing protein [Comamonadaceae bacterium]|nr:toll/interleukin-1 receptor domain-containing protein [Comamonadaceae bacterium]